MTGAFHTREEAEQYVREWLSERAEGGPDGSGDRPMYSDEVLTGIDDINAQVYEDLKAMCRASDLICTDDALALHADLLWRDAVRYLGDQLIIELVDFYLRPSPEAEMERLIRAVGPGYHPDTPYDGYEPPITQFTPTEWAFIHRRFNQDKTDPRDIYEFGLPIIHEMLEQTEDRYPDGSRASLVVMEEVEAQLQVFNGPKPEEALLEVLMWCDAARDIFAKAIRKNYALDG